MDLPVESAITSPGADGRRPASIAGRPLEEWNAAYAKVENYFHALRIRNKALLGQLVIRVLKRAMRRAPHEPERSATELAAEEMDALVTEWFAAVLQAPPTNADQMLSTRGRLALLLADMPGKWQDQFLRPPRGRRNSSAPCAKRILRAGPDFQLSKMTPRPLDLGPITTLTNLSRLPYPQHGRWRGLLFVPVPGRAFLSSPTEPCRKRRPPGRSRIGPVARRWS